MKLSIYGIRNCDTMKKAFAWLESHKLAYDFHDYKRAGSRLVVGFDPAEFATLR